MKKNTKFKPLSTNPMRRLHYYLLIGVIVMCGSASNIPGTPIPFPKQMVVEEESLKLENATLEKSAPDLAREEAFLKRILEDHKVSITDDGIPMRLKVGSFPLPEIASTYRDEIESQAYRIEISRKGIDVQGRSPRAVFYGLLTLAQLIDENAEVPYAEIVDFPDLPVRMIMLDPARQNENMDYYRRVIQFAARYKINAILCHLTDDQTACLYHEDYPELMHLHAWTKDDIQKLVSFANDLYVDLIPEIESFGHSRMFTRLSDYKDFLHQTASGKDTHGWTGTSKVGYTNVLCPASPKALQYLDKMYMRADATFSHPWLHIGCDEVDITECERCIKKFGRLSPSEWILKHLLQCRELVLKRGKSVALWGDMLLHYPQVVNDLPTTHTIIFAWYYRPDVTEKSSRFFKEKGFEVIACPALVCYPHIIMPDTHNFENIMRFTKIARDNDLLGVNTTIWIPTRYMSDVLWHGIAYAAVQAWSGSKWDDVSFVNSFAADFYGLRDNDTFYACWNDLTTITWHIPEFNTSCWCDEKSMSEAQALATQRKDEVTSHIAMLNTIEDRLARVGKNVRKNRQSWITLERSTKILKYTLEHLMASLNVKSGDEINKELLESLDARCVEAIGWIEEDWNRNRYPDDPNKEGIFLPTQHLLYRFKQMHDFHRTMPGD